MTYYQAIKVGVFVLVTLIAFAILSVSIRGNIFQPTVELVAYFGNVDGLKRGASVKVAGAEVGQVVEVSHAPERHAILVRIAIARDKMDTILQDCVATIGTVGLLGERYVEISYGAGTSSVVPGTEIATTDPVSSSQMLAGLSNLGEQLELVISENRETLKQGISEFRDMAAAIKEIAQQVQTGPGAIHDLIYGATDHGTMQWEDELFFDVEGASDGQTEPSNGVPAVAPSLPQGLFD